MRTQMRQRGLVARFNQQRQPLIALELAVVVALLALLYLSQVAAVTSVHDSLLSEQARQTDLRRQDAEARATLARAQSPAYIEQRARELGMVPANPAAIIWITLHDAGR